ncbi:unnamed protein product [Lymnaea stagnalis]|uniref:Uncharacterized protein n=1 Tax=Lymnaea stagnalis TaxID=6523 RepID=A0AAV2HZ02_LYMST
MTCHVNSHCSMDTQDNHPLQKIWTAAREKLMPHWKKIGILIVGVVILGAAFGYAMSSNKKSSAVCDIVKPSALEASDSCPWQLVMSDLTHRLRLIEMAFKEQVIAREVIAAEVTNQSYSNHELERKLDNFTSSLKQLTYRLDKLNEQLGEMTSRIYSDECLGFLVLVFVAGQVILTLRSKLQLKLSYDQGQPVRHNSRDLTNQNGSGAGVVRSNSSISGSHQVAKPNTNPKQDVCVIGFNKQSLKLCLAQTEALLECLCDDVSTLTPPSHVIACHDALGGCPKARLYLVQVDCVGDREHLDVSKEAEKQSKAILTTTLRHLKSIGGHVIIVISNEEQSNQLPALSLYNTNLPILQSSDVVQELASNGKVLSVWKELTPHQLSHVRKVARSLLALKAK